MLRNRRLFLEKKSSNIINTSCFFCKNLWDEMHPKSEKILRQGVEPCVVAPGTSYAVFFVVASKPTFQTQVQGEDKQPEEQAQWRIFMDFTDFMVVVMKYFKAITVSLYNLYCKQHMPFVCKCGDDLLSLVDTDVDFWHPRLKGGQKQRRTETWCWSFKSVRNPKRFL